MKTLNINRLLALILALLMLASLASCSDKNEFANEEDARTVLTLGKYEVPYDEYRYLYMNYKQQIDNGDESYWEEHPEREADLLEYVHDALLLNYGTLALADEYDIKITAEEKASILEIENERIASIGSEEAFLLALEGSYMSRRVFRSMIELQYIEEKLYNQLTAEMANIIPSDDATVEADIAKNFVRIQQIMIINDDGDDREANRTQAEEILSKLQAGEDFEALMTQYSEDEEILNPIDGYYFTHNEFALLPGFDELAFGLDIGETSGVYEGPASYHIIRRMPLEDDYINKNFETLRTSYIARCFYEMIDEAAAGLELRTTELYDSLKLATMQ
ncbi:MAG: peptidylprolyl isomerase [Clostridia bacterium]|nr:peptidylprolyl isomerase [Clostridia bacterium]